MPKVRSIAMSTPGSIEMGLAVSQGLPTRGIAGTETMWKTAAVKESGRLASSKAGSDEDELELSL